MTLLVASSPVEIDAEAAEAGLSPAARDTARRLFHTLTDHLGQAVIDLSVKHETWPTHRFYFSPKPDGLAPLLAGLRARTDILDVTQSVAAPFGPVAGLFCHVTADGFAAVLVGHESHEGYLSPHPAR